MGQVLVQHTDALLVVDAQLTFMPGGGLAVKDGDQVVPVIRSLMDGFPRVRRFATQDLHPQGHVSLASSYRGLAPMTQLTYNDVLYWVQVGNSSLNIARHALFSMDELRDYLEHLTPHIQVLWPDHAIQGTAEAELHPEFPKDDFWYVQQKGRDPKCDSYSGFFDNLHRPTGLAWQLHRAGVRRVICCGLAYDYCVGWTAQDAREEGFEAVVVMDATKPVDFPEGSVENMTRSLESKGVLLVDSVDLKF